MGYRWGGEVSKLSVAQPALGREWRNLLAVFLVLLLAGCGGMSRVGDLFSDDPAPSQTAPPVKNTSIALLLPLSAPGETQNIARALQQAAELAVKDVGSGTLIIKDTGGTADMARRPRRKQRSTKVRASFWARCCPPRCRPSRPWRGPAM